MEAMILRAGLETPLQMIKGDIASTINFIIHMDRQSDGKRRVTEVIEVIGREGDVYTTREIFKWSQSTGFKSTGNVPHFVQVGEHPQLEINKDFFVPNYKYKGAA